MNATDSHPAPVRRWRRWWLLVPTVPLAVFAAALGYDSLQAQQPGPSPPPRDAYPAYPEPRGRSDDPFSPPNRGSANQASVPAPNFPPPHHRQDNRPPAATPHGFAPPRQDPARNLADELRRLDPNSDGYDAKRAALEETLAKQFDERQHQQRLQLAEAQQRLMQLQLDWKNREAAKQQIVTRRINELLGEPDPLRWDPAPLHMPPQHPGMPYPTPRSATQAASGSPPRAQPEIASQDNIRYFGTRVPKTDVPVPNSAPQQGVPVSPDSRTFRPVTSLPPGQADQVPPPQPTPFASPRTSNDANRVARELVQRMLEIKSKQAELKQTEELVRRNAAPLSERLRVASELEAAQQQRTLLELQLEQLRKQAELQFGHARQAIEIAEKRVQLASKPLDDPDRDARRQQQRDIAEAESEVLQARMQLELAELQISQLEQLQVNIGEVDEPEAETASEPEEVEVAD